MKPTEPLPLHHSWPLAEREARFGLGSVFNLDPHALPELDMPALARRGIGFWECDLIDNALRWTAPVYDLFGLPRGQPVRREDALALYAPESRAAMEALRAHAIRHRRGFTLNAEIRPGLAGSRWMRLIAAPICDGDRVIRLYGLKQPI
ncbi:MAG: hypothetical protein ABS87_04780 [Sphingomonas sp. SCN 67-18]|uniref:hypothetical protein n=1 Tax=uncultured Sphingomonas sp. TaxID=158754 RepID=UPI000868356A|nr:hypothetical protein [Sphingomonas sp. SCN 67-18]ODU21684.1 MAG: hypothetical protein ABS87_04780 [Sphingomonas sp. SCN 67-18]